MSSITIYTRNESVIEFSEAKMAKILKYFKCKEKFNKIPKIVDFFIILMFLVEGSFHELRIGHKNRLLTDLFLLTGKQ